ncbi:MAG: tetratricopeptide repeat protein [Candidatus Latescibacteria bacterium]|nr:tetratricopeptide repeat protein [Candidatus Latescibacterota bacterium]
MKSTARHVWGARFPCWLVLVIGLVALNLPVSAQQPSQKPAAPKKPATTQKPAAPPQATQPKSGMRTGGRPVVPDSPEEAQRRAAAERFLAAVAIAKNNLAATYYVKALYDSAAVQLRHALNIAPDFAAAHLTLGLVYYAKGQRQDAVEEFRAAAADDSIGQRQMASAPPDTVYNWAKAQFSRFVTGIPNLAAAHAALGAVYDEAEFDEDAEQEYLRAIAADSSYAGAYINLGRLYNDAGEFDEAIRVYEKALALKAELPKVYLNLGASYMGKGRTDDAIRAWRTAIDLSPQYAEAYLNLGIAYHNQGLADSAVACWERAIATQPNFIAPRVALARLRVNQGRYRDAETVYQKVFELGAKDPVLYTELAFVCEQQEKYDEALANYQEALKLDPDNSDAKTSLSIVTQRKQQREAARQANKVRVRQIVVRTAAEADSVLAQLQRGADFTDLARTRSIDPSASVGGDLGFFGPGDMLPVFEKAAMALKVGEVSGVVQTPMGFHVIKRIE